MDENLDKLCVTTYRHIYYYSKLCMKVHSNMMSNVSGFPSAMVLHSVSAG